VPLARLYHFIWSSPDDSMCWGIPQCRTDGTVCHAAGKKQNKQATQTKSKSNKTNINKSNNETS
jgi:hypothetical protein